MTDDTNIASLDITHAAEDAEFAQQEAKLHDFYSKLVYRMRITRGARYQAAQRHKRRAQASIWAIISLSLYVFTSNVLTVIFSANMDPITKSLLGIISIVMSAFIIAFSVLESGHKHELKSELFLRNAQNIGELHDKSDYEIETSIEDRIIIEETLKKYNELINEFPYNHSESDFKNFRSKTKKDKYKFLERVFISIKYYFDCWGIMWASIVFPPLTFWLLSNYFTSPPSP